MRTFLKLTAQLFRVILALFILLFALATFMGKSYFQTFTLVLLAFAFVCWPFKWDKTTLMLSRLAFIAVLLLLNIFFFKPDTRTSIYASEDIKTELYTIYDKNVKYWPENTEDLYLDTKYGKVHILVCGKKENPPLMMIHAASMGAHSWAENLAPLLEHYRIYSFDNIGEGNKSELSDIEIYPKDGKELADLYASLADKLGIKSCPVFGASNGGYIAQNYAFYYPEKVEKLALFGPMGLTHLTMKSIFMLGAATIYPFDKVREHVGQWALGDSEVVNKKYGDWFNCILKGTIPSISQPFPMSYEQKQQMQLPVLLFLGTKDPIVGEVSYAQKKAKDYPNIEIEVLESGHLIAVEKAEVVNKKVKYFLNLNN